MKKSLRYGTSLIAMSLVAGLATAGHAQSAAASAAANKDIMSLDQVVVTATSRTKKKMKVSLSVTDVKPALIAALAPQSQAEVLRLIPGMIVGDTAGPGGNANISVRGLPITTGGSPFVQLQEDGLPTVLTGDMNFGNNDYWIRYDNGDTVEAVRGGSSSTFASQAPGAVINYISPTGTTKGGSFTVTRGLGYDDTKVDFDYGAPVSDTLRYHFDGFAKDGDGVRNEGWEAEKGYQFKGNVTQDFNDGQGYIRFNVKFLDDQEPTNTSYPVLASVGGNGVTSVSAFPGFDARTGTTVGIYNRSFDIVNTQGQLQQVESDGIHPVAKAFGTEVHYKIAGDISLDDNFRYTAMNGNFSTNFMGATAAASVIGSTVNGHTVGSIVYADGPHAGQVFSGKYLNTGTQIYTNMRDMGSIGNDLSVNDKFEFGDNKLAVKAGVFYFDQTIAEDWHPNSNYQELSGKNPAELNLFTGLNGTGQQLTANGVSGYNTAWGQSVARSYDMQVADTAPYIDLTYDFGPLDLDGSVRYETVGVTGWAEDAYNQNATCLNTGDCSTTASTSFNTMSDGVAIPTYIPDSNSQEILNYRTSATSWSFGALYAVNNDISVFARGSKGNKINTDRNILSGYTNPDGSLNASGKSNAWDTVYQEEVGAKTRGDLGAGFCGFNITGFHDSFGVSNFDLTATSAADPDGTYYQSAYEAYGIELETSYAIDNFSINANVTYTDATETKNLQGPSASALMNLGSGFPPANTPPWVWMIAPTYSYGPVTGGLVIQGQGATNASSSGVFDVPAQNFVDLFANYNMTKNLVLGLHVNNLLNSFGVNGHADQASASGIAALGAVGGYAGVMTAPGETGRTVAVSLGAKF